MDFLLTAKQDAKAAKRRFRSFSLYLNLVQDVSKQNLPPTEIGAEEIPNAITLALARLHSFQPQSAPIASKQELINVSIRRCKKLAS